MNAAPSKMREEIASASAAVTTAASAAAMASRTRRSLTPELVSARMAVRPVIATAGYPPYPPLGGSVTVTTNVVTIRTRTRP
jgi:hypothetical protein